MEIVNKKSESYNAGTTTAASATIDLTQDKLLGVQNSNDTTALTFYASADNATFGALCYNGTAQTIATSVANAYYVFDEEVFADCKYIKITKATAATLKLVKQVD